MARFEVIPAIDIIDGKCVRLLQGDFNAMTVYSGSPTETAKKWEEFGATRLHIVDLDGAKTGFFKNIPIIKEIAKALSIPIQVGGGLRTKENIEELISAGVDRVMLGTAVVEDPGLVKEMCKKHGQKIAVSIDSKGGKTAIKGWQVSSDKSPVELAKEAVKMGVKRFIYTDISRDGTLIGPNLDGIRAFVRAVNVPVIASGGVSSCRDIGDLKKLSDMGVEGCVVGKALYSGAIDLKVALDYNAL